MLSFYRRPDERNLLTFLNEFDSILESTRPVIVTADLNIYLKKNDLAVSRYKFILESNSISIMNDTSDQSVTFPITQGIGFLGSIIDHFGTNFFAVEYNRDTINSSLSDHNALMLSIFGGSTIGPIS